MYRALLAGLAIGLLSISAGPLLADSLAIPETQMITPETQASEPETQGTEPEEIPLSEPETPPAEPEAPLSEPEPQSSEPEIKKETFSVTLPGRGMTMEQVEARFGAPGKKNPAVGTPPITTWVYDAFSVYFEGRYVIHAVFEKPR